MREGVSLTGVPSKEELEGSPGFPSKEHLLKKMIAVIECVQEIPCDVCGSICPHDAIEVSTLKSLPRLVEEECTGCGVCIPFCPGLAIFLVNYNYSREEALISFPHEFQPLPEVGASVEATDRLGQSITKGRVVKVTERENYDCTVVVSIAVPKKFAQVVRGIKLPIGR
jgi:Fe-S-cluster-containing hydrogenase component 2